MCSGGWRNQEGLLSQCADGSMHDQGLHRDSWWWSPASTQRYTHHSNVGRMPVPIPSLAP